MQAGTDAAEPVPVPGAPTIPGYVIDGLLGRGGFATVYGAHQEAVGGRVAVKVLHGVDADPDALLRFERETRAMAALRGHPSIVTVFDAGVADDGRPYLVMELIEGGSLHGEVARRAAAGEGLFGTEEVLPIAAKVASALAAAHAAGILHRDLKPGNVLLSAYGEPLLTDFGIARLADHDASVAGTALSPGFSAPEIVQGGQPTVASDVFAFGCTAYALMAGRSPFRRPGDAGLMPALARTVEEEPPDLRAEGVPDVLWQIVDRALAKDPAARFPDMVAVVEALQAAEAALGLPVTRVPLPEGAGPTPVAGAGAAGTPGAAGAAGAVGAVGEAGTAVIDVGAALAGPAAPGSGVAAAPLAPPAPAPAPTPAGTSPPQPAAVPARSAASARARTWVAVAVAALALAGVTAGLLWWSSPDEEAEREAFEAAFPLVEGPRRGVEVAGDPPGEEGIRQLYGRWGLRINNGEIEAAHLLYDPGAQLTAEDIDIAFGPLWVRRLVIADVRPLPDGTEVDVRYVTSEATTAEVGADCMVHDERHRLVGPPDEVRIAEVRVLADPAPC